MAIPILKLWEDYFSNPHEGLGSSYERVILNQKLYEVLDRYHIRSVLEVPSFGFTGVSGINSMGMAKRGCAVTLCDHDAQRVEKIRTVWDSMGLPADIKTLESYRTLPFDDKQFDMTWNFSALWFAESLFDFLYECSRITDKVMFLCVPNRMGIGFLTQKYQGADDLKKYLREENILPGNIRRTMNRLGWKQVEARYIDCPPWPDIGMMKEDFLAKLGIKLKPKPRKQELLSILSSYDGSDPNFEAKMHRYDFLERFAPACFKMFWAHHRYFLFVRDV